MPVRARLTPEMADARRAIRDIFADPELGGCNRVLLAVSGGPDSMALALACSFELPKLGIAVSALVVDHGLQGGSDEIASRAVSQLEKLGISAASVRVKVRARGEGLEAAARAARYQALEKERLRVGAQKILLAHNLDDQAETVLLGLTRGSGLRSIAGMKQIDGDLVRPFLGISKAALRKSCQDAGIEFWDDPHNQDPAFTRVRIRKLMTTLETELGPGVTEAFARTAALASEAEEFLSAEALKLIQSAQQPQGLAIAELSRASVAVRRKALQLWLLGAGARSVSRSQVLLVEELITNWHGQKPLKLSGITVERVAQALRTTTSH